MSQFWRLHGHVVENSVQTFMQSQFDSSNWNFPVFIHPQVIWGSRYRGDVTLLWSWRFCCSAAVLFSWPSCHKMLAPVGCNRSFETICLVISTFFQVNFYSESFPRSFLEVMFLLTSACDLKRESVSVGEEFHRVAGQRLKTAEVRREQLLEMTVYSICSFLSF